MLLLRELGEAPIDPSHERGHELTDPPARSANALSGHAKRVPLREMCEQRIPMLRPFLTQQVFREG
jgi:hypothetical protein